MSLLMVWQSLHTLRFIRIQMGAPGVALSRPKDMSYRSRYWNKEFDSYGGRNWIHDNKSRHQRLTLSQFGFVS